MKPSRPCLLLPLLLVGTATAAQLFPVEVTIAANAANASVFLGGESHGKTPASISIRPGTYSLRVTASGYDVYEREFAIGSAGKQEYNIELSRPAAATAQGGRPNVRQAQRASARTMVSITSNVSGAAVTMNGGDRGRTPTTVPLAEGLYDVAMVADGFLPLNTQLTVIQSSRQAFHFTMLPASATLNIVIPDRFVNPFVVNPLQQFKVYIDGNLANPSGNLQPVTVNPGPHTIALVSGGLVLTTPQPIDFQGGATYLLTIVNELQISAGS